MRFFVTGGSRVNRRSPPSGRPALRVWLAFVLCAIAGLAGATVLPVSTPASAGADLTPFSEYEVKAAFIYNFAKFVDWPESAFRGPGDPLSVCILGEDPFGEILDRTLRDKSVHERPLQIRRFTGVRELQPCNILFVCGAESLHLEDVLESLWGSPVLTIGETPRFGRLGGIITFVIEQSRVRFEINAGAAERAGLRISSKLLSLARSVRDGRQSQAH